MKQELNLEKLSFKNNNNEDLVLISKLNLKYNLKPLIWNRFQIEEGEIEGIKISSLNFDGFKNDKLTKIKTNELTDLNENLSPVNINQFEDLLSTEDPLEKIQEINKELKSKSNKRIVLELSNKIQSWKTRKEKLILSKEQPTENDKIELLEIKKEVQENINQINEKMNEDLVKIKNWLS